MTSEELQRSVAEALTRNPKIDNEVIAVYAESGVVTLRGSVRSLPEKRHAVHAAKRVRGVVYVNDELDVKLLTGAGRQDAEVRADVLRVLSRDPHVPAGVDATVKDGFVTLTGGVDWQYQRYQAALIAEGVPGVTGVDDQICLNRPVPVDGTERAIRQALAGIPALYANDIGVMNVDGVVILMGTVRSMAERDAAVAAASTVPGVRTVEDWLTVVAS